MKVKYKAYGKINLTLNVGKRENGFHPIDSIVSTVNIYDEITVKPRKDDEITLKIKNSKELENSDAKTNNAYKAAELFQNTFQTCGVDIEIKKGIPIGSGLGGSSADISGTLNALKKLFMVDGDMKSLADKLGSDSGYMLRGGTARISGRGEKVKFLKNLSLHVVLLFAKQGVDTSLCYKTFDELNSNGLLSDNDKVERAIESGEDFFDEINNGLYNSAKEINKEVEENLELMKSFSPLATNMSGSGATVFGIFKTEKECKEVAQKLKKLNKTAKAV